MTFVRRIGPVIECNSKIWSHRLYKHIFAIENVQRYFSLGVSIHYVIHLSLFASLFSIGTCRAWEVKNELIPILQKLLLVYIQTNISPRNHVQACQLAHQKLTFSTCLSFVVKASIPNTFLFTSRRQLQYRYQLPSSTRLHSTLSSFISNNAIFLHI